MHEFTGPGAVKIAADDNVVAALFERARREPEAEAFAVREGNVFHPLTVGSFVSEVRSLAAGLLGLGLDPGTRVCLFSKTRYEFTQLDFAILAAGCVTVPIYESDSSDQVKWVISNSGAVAVFIEDAALKKQFDAVADELPDCKHVFVIDDGGLDELRAHGQAVEPDSVDRRVAAITHDHLATLVYTSGTTGQPKGCTLTHGNLIFEVRQVGSAGSGAVQGRRFDAHVPPARPRARPRRAVRLRAARRADRVRARASATSPRSCRCSPRRGCSACPASSRRSTTVPRRRPAAA